MTASKRIYVGNLPFSATDEQVRELFAHHGEVQSVALITDRETGRPRGFGFVEMASVVAVSAIEALDGFDLAGRRLRVNEARERHTRRKGWRAGGGGRGRGGWGSGGGKQGW